MSAPAASAPVISTHPLLGVIGVLFGAMIATCTGRLISLGLADMRGALHLGFDEASWIGTAFNAALMFIGPFSVYLGGLLGSRRVLLTCAFLFTVISLALPYAGSLPVMLVLLVLAGLTAGTFYPPTLSFVLRNLPQRYVLVGIAMYAMDIIFTTNFATSLEAWYIDHLSWRWIFWNSAALTPIMASFRHHRWSLGLRYLPDCRHGGAKATGAESAGQFQVSEATEHSTARSCPDFFPICPARDCADHSELPGRGQGISALANRPSAAVGCNSSRSVWGNRCLSPEVRRCASHACGVVRPVAVACVMNTNLSSAWAGANLTASQLVMAIGYALSFYALVGAIILEVFNTGALSRPIDVLTFAGYFQTVRLFGGELGAAFMQHFIPLREQFHSNILGLGVLRSLPQTDQRLIGLTIRLASRSCGLPSAVGRAVELLALQVRQQAFTLAITDVFTLVAWSTVCCLVVVACMARVPTQYQQIVSTSVTNA